jgi:surface protein
MFTKNGNILKINGNWLNPQPEPDPYNPLNLPPNTVRVRTNDGEVPYKGSGASYGTATLVPGTTDVYDVYKSGTNFNTLLWFSSNVVEVLGANTTGITSMSYMLSMCSSLTNVALFDTSNVTNMSYMFEYCSSLITVTLFNTSKLYNMLSMFYNCTNVETGALALYQQASTQATPPYYYGNAFRNCGRNTVTGAAELAQIPDDWK